MNFPLGEPRRPAYNGAQQVARTEQQSTGRHVGHLCGGLPSCMPCLALKHLQVPHHDTLRPPAYTTQKCRKYRGYAHGIGGVPDPSSDNRPHRVFNACSCMGRLRADCDRHATVFLVEQGWGSGLIDDTFFWTGDG